MGHDLGVRLGRQRDTRGAEFIAQFSEVLDDAVVDDGDGAVGAHVRVRIGVGRTAVSGPPGVADAQRCGLQGILAQQSLEVGQLARLLAHIEALAGDDRDPRGVVAAVLQAAQALDHDLERLLLADVPHDPAHGCQRTR